MLTHQEYRQLVERVMAGGLTEKEIDEIAEHALSDCPECEPMMSKDELEEHDRRMRGTFKIATEMFGTKDCSHEKALQASRILYGLLKKGR